jgi:hypothetical protein
MLDAAERRASVGARAGFPSIAYLREQRPVDRCVEVCIGATTASLDGVVTTLSTRGGTPDSSKMCARASMDNGVCSADLTTQVHPAASAGAILRVPIARGKFQGVMKRHGPTGCNIVSSRRALSRWC